MATLVQPLVRRLQSPAADVFDWLAEQGTDPVVLTGCLDRWPLMAELQKAANPGAQVAVLERLIGHRKLHYTTIAPEQDGQLGYTADGKGTNFAFTSGKRVPFSQFAGALRSTLSAPDRGAVYMQSASLGGFPELLPHVPDFPYLAGGAAGYRQLWIGSGGHVVNLHFDPTHNLIAMLTGRKRVTLLPPDNMANLYPAPLDCRLGDAIGSQVKLLQPDFVRHPRAAGELGKARVATLEPGDILYIPPMWWHHVESFGLNVMLNKWVLPVSPAHFTDITANVVRGILLFSGMPETLRVRCREAHAEALFGTNSASAEASADTPASAEPPDPQDPVYDRVPASMRARAIRYMADTARVLHGVPPALRRSLPALYDYYVFQLDDAPALSSRDPAGFRRKLKLYAGIVGAIRAAQSLASKPRRLVHGRHGR